MHAFMARPAAIRAALGVGTAVLLAILWAGGMVATVKPLASNAAPDASPSAGLAFNAAAYVDSIWPSRVVPAARQGVALPTLLTELKADPEAAKKRYGHVVGGVANYLVRFTGIVNKIDTSSPLGALTVTVKTPAAAVSVQVQVGPVILGTAVRDALPFINFNEFLNQVQYGGVADALNAKVKKVVLSKLDLGKLAGRKISVDGALPYDGTEPDDLTVTPIVLSSEQRAP